MRWYFAFMDWLEAHPFVLVPVGLLGIWGFMLLLGVLPSWAVGLGVGFSFGYMWRGQTEKDRRLKEGIR